MNARYSAVTGATISEPWWAPGTLTSPQAVEWNEPGFSGNILLGVGSQPDTVTVFFFNFTT